MTKYRVGDIVHFTLPSWEDEPYWIILRIRERAVDMVSVLNPEYKETVFRWDTISGAGNWKAAKKLNDTKPDKENE
jgi:hypothetical protein